MKKLFFAMFAAAFMFSLSTFAQVEEQTQPEETITASAEAVEIEFDQLPDMVKTSFEGSDYAMWDVTSVRQMVSNEGTTQYQITVSDGTKEESVVYNDQGEEVEQ
ncbi:hypothetical protein [Tunicatimonas pelagia]|uniref:hypothetical protein n=1 Tax=Tunicatimonas pelagia TaxID=931531 RepID=UPI002666A24E|nr:hypothetical protein [Tunicatimonas pelagia]WKN42678.1 hypothetical protein P0M28_26940 [Tunicatimonas pelagia]